jgi:hypothetical protein
MTSDSSEAESIRSSHEHLFTCPLQMLSVPENTKSVCDSHPTRSDPEFGSELYRT